jgi:hypothetical protein
MNAKSQSSPPNDPDLADALLLAMLNNPHLADEIAALSDDELAQIAAETPFECHTEPPANDRPDRRSPWHVGGVEPDRQYDSGIVGG